MKSAKHRSDESASLQALHALDVLDSEPEAEFDALVRAASLACGAPIALISLIDTDRQWFKANVGLPGVTQTGRDVSFCAHAVLGDEVFEVRDARLDPRFADNPLVAGDPAIRFYAGAPLRLAGGHRVGTLCIIDQTPRVLTEAQREVLHCLSMAASRAFEGRRASRDLMAAARVSEERLRRLYDATPAMLHSIGPDGKILAVSDLWLSKLGYARHEVIGRPSVDFLSPASRVFASEVALPRFFESGRADDVSYQLVTRNGEAMDVLMSASLERDAQGRPLRSLAVSEDVTLRRKAERELQHERQRLANIIDAADVGTWEWDLRTGALHVSPRYAQLVGRTAGESAPATVAAWRAHIHPDDLPRLDALLKEHLAGRTTHFVVELRLRHAEGHWIWAMDRGRVVARDADNAAMLMIGTRWDITDRKALELQLKSASEQVLDLYDNAPCGYHSLDADGVFVHINATALAWLGCRRDEVIGKKRATDFFTPEGQAQFRQNFGRLMSQGRVEGLEFDLVPKAGPGRRVSVTATAINDEAGRFLMTRTVMFDITELRRVEQHAQELDRLLAERNEMLDVLAHEVRQPLNNASAALQSAVAVLAERCESAASEQMRRAQSVLGAVMTGLDNTLAVASVLAGAGEITLADTDIDLLVAICVADMPAPSRGRIHIERQTPTRTIWADAVLMRLALRNLLANALEFSPPDARVTIRISESDAPLAVMIDVADRGAGIDPAILPWLFERGVRGSAMAHRPSHGLGLYIVRRALALQGGEAALLQTGPAGTTMRLQFNESAQGQDA